MARAPNLFRHPPARIAQSRSASVSERFDAQAEVQKSALRSLAPEPEALAAIRFIAEELAETEMRKAQGDVSNSLWRTPKARGARGPQSVILDDFQIVAQGGYYDRPGILAFDSMQSMVQQTPILNAIIQTRIRQMKALSRPQGGDLTKPGFRIVHVDETAELGDDQQEEIKQLESFIVNCGWEDDPRRRKRMRRDNYTAFCAKSVRDMLTYDANPIETEWKRNRGLGLDGFYAIDGKTIRLCTEEGYEGDDEIQALQVIDGRIVTAYTYDDLVYEVRNPNTDVTSCGYGMSETEMLIRVVTYILNTMSYNGDFFDKNSIPRGILTLIGDYDAADLGQMKRYWMAQQRGAKNAHNLPIMAAKNSESKAEFVEIGGQLSEMAFGKWMTFLGSIACAIYGTAPEEINLESYAASDGGLGKGNDTGERLVSANDKGFKPLAAHHADVMSDFVVRTFSRNYRLQYGGMDGDDAKQRFEARKLGETWNEFRKAEGKPAIDGPMGDMPMNAAFIPVWQAVTGIGQPEPEEDDFGDPSAQGGRGYGDDDGDKGGGASDPDETGRTDGAPAGSDFGAPGDDGGDPDGFGKSMPDFGLPTIYQLEA